MGLPHPDEHAILTDALAKARRVLADLLRQAEDLRTHAAQADRAHSGAPLTADVLRDGEARLAGAADAVRATIAALEAAVRTTPPDAENPSR